MIAGVADAPTLTLPWRHFGVTLAFQNCHRVAVFPAGARGGSRHRGFTSARAQLRNQAPGLRDC